MKIPSESANQGLDRLQLFQDVVQACFYTQKRRIEQYEVLRHYWLYGCGPEGDSTPYNKVEPVVDTLSAFLYGADSTRFSARMTADEKAPEWDKAVPIARAVNDQWTTSGADQIFGQAIDLALVFNSTFIKSIVNGKRFVPYVVEPHCLGVYREDIVGLDRQEAIAHRYYITKTQLENELSSHTPERRRQILDSLTARPKRDRDEMPEGLRRIIITNMAGVSPLTPGNTVTGNGTLIMSERIDYIARISADVIEMTELWIRDDALGGDWRTVTLAENSVVVFDRPNIFLPALKDEPGEQPFNQVCPMPMNGYFWGGSFAAKLIGLQGWRNTRVAEIQQILAQQARPPVTLTGFTGLIDENDFALNRPGGVFNNTDPMGKVERHDRPVPGDLWADVAQIDAMFSEAAALPPLLMGRGETGVRSERQTSTLSKLGSSRIKKRALAIEDNLDALATKMFRTQRRYNSTKYQTAPVVPSRQPTAFILGQAPWDTLLQVDGHSNSPLFSEDSLDVAITLFKAGAIDRETLIELVDPPQRELLLQRLDGIEERERAAAQARMQQEMAVATAKGQPPGPQAGLSKPGSQHQPGGRNGALSTGEH